MKSFLNRNYLSTDRESSPALYLCASHTSILSSLDEYYFDENELCQGCRRHLDKALALTQLIPSDKKHPSEVRIKISASAEISLLTLTKKAGVLRSWMSFIPFPLGVEFTNSYQEPVNSTSHFDAYFSSFLLIIDALCYKCHHFCNKKLPPYGI